VKGGGEAGRGGQKTGRDPHPVTLGCKRILGDESLSCSFLGHLAGSPLPLAQGLGDALVPVGAASGAFPVLERFLVISLCRHALSALRGRFWRPLLGFPPPFLPACAFLFLLFAGRKLFPAFLFPAGLCRGSEPVLRPQGDTGVSDHPGAGTRSPRLALPEPGPPHAPPASRSPEDKLACAEQLLPARGCQGPKGGRRGPLQVTDAAGSCPALGRRGWMERGSSRLGASGQGAAPSSPQPSPYLRVSLDDVVLDAAFGAELLLAQEAAVLAHRVVPLQDRASSCSPKQRPKCRGGVAPPPPVKGERCLNPRAKKTNARF